MTGTGNIRRGFHPLAEMASQIIDPILRRRAGLDIQLLESWPEIIGAEGAELSQPLKIIWPRRTAGDDSFEPATLVVACEGFAALKMQHESSEIIQRVNIFFGFAAIARLKIEQKPVHRGLKPLKPMHYIDETQKKQLEQMTATIENTRLRQSLFSLGTAVLSDKNDKGGGKL